ncbi:hypothetical protein J5N97_004598 [Dioscorea zingiberensis]|uniref:Uncharacterized protein n=1 Tax=Dioscorea zingiberensis TaxID=325984 RepID=A0A9D5D862_9LILI|nr:hypothetical protein J5N97_004598 [Dioscorea zingiberensis]
MLSNSTSTAAARFQTPHLIPIISLTTKQGSKISRAHDWPLERKGSGCCTVEEAVDYILRKESEGSPRH